MVINIKKIAFGAMIFSFGSFCAYLLAGGWNGFENVSNLSTSDIMLRHSLSRASMLVFIVSFGVVNFGPKYCTVRR